MIRVYERSRLQSYGGAIRAGIVIAETMDIEEAARIVDDLSGDDYCCFALLESGAVLSESVAPRLLRDMANWDGDEDEEEL